MKEVIVWTVAELTEICFSILGTLLLKNTNKAIGPLSQATARWAIEELRRSKIPLLSSGAHCLIESYEQFQTSYLYVRENDCLFYFTKNVMAFPGFKHQPDFISLQGRNAGSKVKAIYGLHIFDAAQPYTGHGFSWRSYTQRCCVFSEFYFSFLYPSCSSKPFANSPNALCSHISVM